MIDLDDVREIERIDKGNFAGLIESFPEHLEEGAKIASEFVLPRWKSSGISNVVVAGLGGSAIAAELVKSYFSYKLPLPFSIVRHYLLPDSVNQKSLVVCSSYSGSTEETLSVFQEAKKRKAKIISIASGGKLVELSQRDRVAVIIIPGGLPPRAALGYSLAALLVLLGRLGLVKPESSKEIKKRVAFLKNFGKDFLASTEEPRNPAKSLAKRLHGKIPIIYAGEDYFSAVALRWKQQICENAKVLAFCNVFPEFNHNELVGWGKVEGFRDKLAVVILKDKDDHRRVRARMQIVKKILEEKGVEVIEVESSGKTLLSRILSLVHFGDWTSYYLAMLNQVDPAPVEVIDYLKKSLAEFRGKLPTYLQART